MTAEIIAKPDIIAPHLSHAKQLLLHGGDTNWTQARNILSQILHFKQYKPALESASELKTEILINRAIAYRMLNHHQFAVDDLTRASEINFITGNKSLKLEIATDLMDIYRIGDRNQDKKQPFRKDIETAKFHRDRALAIIAEENENVAPHFLHAKARAYLYIGLLESQLENSDEAAIAYLTGLQIASSIRGLSHEYENTYFQIVSTSTPLLVDRGDGHFVKRLIFEAVEHFIEHDYQRKIENAYISLGKYHESQGLSYIAKFLYYQSLSYASGRYGHPLDQDAVTNALYHIKNMSYQKPLESYDIEHQLNYVLMDVVNNDILENRKLARVAYVLYEYAATRFENLLPYFGADMLAVALDLAKKGNVEKEDIDFHTDLMQKITIFTQHFPLPH